MKRVAILTRGLAFGLAFGAGACSGVSDPGTVGNPGMSPSDASTVDQTSPVGDDASAPVESSPTDDVAPGVDVAVGAPDVAVVDATPDVGVVDTTDAGRDAGNATPDAGGTTFACGATATCVFGSETCCVQAAGGGTVTQACDPGQGAAACPGGTLTALRCVAATDCPTGDLCCLTAAAGGGGMATSQCRPVAQGGQCPMNQQELCGPTLGVADPACPNAIPTCRAPVGMGGGAVRLPAMVGVCQ